MNNRVNSKLPHVGTTIFSTISRLAAEKNCINLGQGFPDFPMQSELISAVHQAMLSGHNQYTPMAGDPLLRIALANKVQRLYGARIDAETSITITPGATYAIYTALSTFIHPGDEVIVLEPAYDSYIPNIEINGGKAVTVPLDLPDFDINFERLANAITPATKCILINNPHNPSGSVLTDKHMRKLIDLVKDTSILLLFDEVYEHLVYDEQEHQSALRYPEIWDRSIVCYSFGKTYHCTGWKLGYCIAPSALTQEIRKVHQYNAFSAFSPAQRGIANYLNTSRDYESLGRFLQAKRDYWLQQLATTQWTWRNTRGSYFICGSHPRLTAPDDFGKAVQLMEEAGVAAIPLSSFYQQPTQQGLLRFCFAKSTETLDAAIERLLIWENK